MPSQTAQSWFTRSGAYVERLKNDIIDVSTRKMKERKKKHHLEVWMESMPLCGHRSIHTLGDVGPYHGSNTSNLARTCTAHTTEPYGPLFIQSAHDMMALFALHLRVNQQTVPHMQIEIVRGLVAAAGISLTHTSHALGRNRAGDALEALERGGIRRHAAYR